MYFIAYLLITLIAGVGCQMITFSPSDNTLQLASKTFAPNIYVASNELNGTIRAAYDLAVDFGRVTGQNGSVIQDDTVKNSSNTMSPIIIVGTIGHSSLIDHLVSSGKLDVSRIKGKWEAYIQTTIENPLQGASRALVIAGSNLQGSIYGLYDISETIGVLPYHFWADIPYKKKDAIYAVPQTKIQEPPSVKYRGIFINDEEIGLMEWAKTRFPLGTNKCPFTHTFYQHIFELILRLRGNLLWPGMKKECAFYENDSLNYKEATRYGIFVGTSHHEPMATAYAEQKRTVQPFDWLTNKKAVQDFFQMGVERARNSTPIWTLGMRGDGDRANEAYTSSTLEEIIDWQQGMLQSKVNPDLSTIPQSWVLYKEVGKYWEAGMNVSEDVTLVWTDDNFGNLNRIPLRNELSRSGGAGVYYHFQYVGEPRVWKWGNTVQDVKTWEQLHLAYECGARQMWVVNVGDIKPLEIPTSHFFAMAYDMSKFQDPKSTIKWLSRFAGDNYDSQYADDVASLHTEFGLLAGRRKWELYNPDEESFAFNVINYEEAEKNLEKWDALAIQARTIFDKLDSSTQPAYFETVLYPILSGYHVVQLYTYRALAYAYKKQQRVSTNSLAGRAHEAFKADRALVKQFQTALNGRWEKFENDAHFGVPDLEKGWVSSNKMPSVDYISDHDTNDTEILGVVFGNINASFPGYAGTNRLQEINPYLPIGEERWLDVFARKNGTFSYKITTNTSFVSISKSSGSITAPSENTDIRSIISVDWNKAPLGLTNVGLIVARTSGDGTNVDLVLPVNKVSIPSSDRSSFIEANGVVSIEATHYSSADSGYIEIPAYGRTLSGVKRWPATSPSISAPLGPKLTYSFHTFTSTASANLTLHLGGTGNVDPLRPLKYAVSADGNEPVVVQPIVEYAMGDHPKDWVSVVKDSVRRSSNLISLEKAGAHELNLWLLEPEMVVVKIVINLGGELDSYLGPPESYRTISQRN